MAQSFRTRIATCFGSGAGCDAEASSATDLRRCTQMNPDREWSLTIERARGSLASHGLRCAPSRHPYLKVQESRRTCWDTGLQFGPQERQFLIFGPNKDGTDIGFRKWAARARRWPLGRHDELTGTKKHKGRQTSPALSVAGQSGPPGRDGLPSRIGRRSLDLGTAIALGFVNARDTAGRRDVREGANGCKSRFRPATAA
jgi:hypothetical protein